MRRTWQHPARAALLAAVVTAAACTDARHPLAPDPKGNGPPAPPGTPVTVQALLCSADVAKRTVECGSQASGDFLPKYLLVGGQNVFVKLTSTSVNYNAGTGAFTFDVTLRNLIPQPLGTADWNTLAPDPAGVRVFFHSGPAVTSGTGTVTVVADGTADFTATGQPYYQYDAVLEQFEVTAPRTWRLDFPATVQGFSFLLLVAAVVPYENGWVDITGNFTVQSGSDRQLQGLSRSVVGIPDSAAAVTWSVGDPTRASVSGTGVVHGLRAGSTAVNALASDGRTGVVTVQVTPVRRVWTGAADTDWSNGANWLPDGVAPEPADSAVVPDTAALFPALTAASAISQLEVLDLTPGGTVPTVALGAFDLTATGDVYTTSSGAITSTTGILVLAGASRVVYGSLPLILVTGTYTLGGDLTARAPEGVDAGRLQNDAFQMNVDSQ